MTTMRPTHRPSVLRGQRPTPRLPLVAADTGPVPREPIGAARVLGLIVLALLVALVGALLLIAARGRQ